MGITDLLRLNFFNPVCIHSKLPQAERLQLYDWFKNQNSSKILVATDIFGRGIDFRRVNLVINYGNFYFI
jgi:ATP-dependent RNA helicase UAP56/SUB2